MPETLVFKTTEAAERYASKIDPYHTKWGSAQSEHGEEPCLHVINENGDTTHLLVVSESLYETTELKQRGE